MIAIPVPGATTRAPSSEAVGLANAVVLAAVFWATVAVVVWVVFG